MMSHNNVFRVLVCAAVLAVATTSSIAVAATGGACAVRVVGPNSQAAPVIGHLDANGKCLTKAASKTAKADDGGLEASAQCRDLSFSYSKNRSSACEKHGGVISWLAAQ